MPTPNIPPVIPAAPMEAAVLPNAIPAPAAFAAKSVGAIAGFLGTIAAPVLALALVGKGLMMTAGIDTKKKLG